MNRKQRRLSEAEGRRKQKLDWDKFESDKIKNSGRKFKSWLIKILTKI